MKRITFIVLVLTGCVFNIMAQEGKGKTAKILNSPDYMKLIISGTEKDSLENFKGALEDFTKAIAIEAENPLGYDKRAYTQMKMNKFTAALKDVNYALKLDDKYVNAYIHRGLIFYYTEKVILSVPDLDKAVELAPLNGASYFYRGMVKIRLQDFDSGYADLKLAAALKYDQAEDAIWSHCQDRLFVIPKNLPKDSTVVE